LGCDPAGVYDAGGEPLFDGRLVRGEREYAVKHKLMKAKE